MRVLQEAGLHIPEDVATIGFDDLDEAQYSLPTLSTIDPGREEIAETAVRVLLERINSTGPAAPPREILADFRVIERESTATRGGVAKRVLTSARVGAGIGAGADEPALAGADGAA